jgi:VanZ family protein
VLALRYHRRWQIAGILVLLGVLLGTLIPAFWLWPDVSRVAFFAFDKWLHGITFAFLAVWFSGQYSRQQYLAIGAGLFSFGILIELCQRMVSYRTAELMDLAADTVGIAIGLGIALAGVGGWSLRFEERFARRTRDS